MLEIYFGIAMFTAIVMTLVGIVLFVRSHLVASGSVSITINSSCSYIVVRWLTTIILT